MARKKTTKKTKAKTAPPAPSQDEKNRARRVYRKLEKQYPNAKCALEHAGPYELLVATVLSAQCTDDRVNQTTPALFEKYPDVEAMAKAKQSAVEQMIRSTGFYRNKARALREAARDIVDKHGGEVPDTMDELLNLRGVARKTANVVLGNAYGINEGVVVDTHVRRLSQRLGFTEQTNPEKIERDLMALFPRKHWTMLSHLLIWHGRATCKARNPDCDNCCISKVCPKIGVS